MLETAKTAAYMAIMGGIFWAAVITLHNSIKASFLRVKAGQILNKELHSKVVEVEKLTKDLRTAKETMEAALRGPVQTDGRLLH